MRRMVVGMIALSMLATPIHSYADAVTLDPLLAGTIAGQIEVEKKLHEKRSKDRKETVNAQMLIAAGLEEIHRVENDILKYLGNASSVLTNSLQIASIIDYAFVQIPKDMGDVLKAVKEHPQGAALEAICTKQGEKIYAEATELVTLVQTLVNSKYSLGEAKGESDKNNVNLLSSAERYYILFSVESKLRKIHSDLRFMQYYIKHLTWRDLWKTLDKESYYNAILMKININDIIRKWDQLAK